MSRQSDTAELLGNYLCTITREYPFINPVEIIPCGHLFDERALDRALQDQPNTCSCCRGIVESKRPLSHREMTNFAYFLSQHPESYQEVHFNLDYFKEIVQQNKLKEPIGERFLTVLEHATNYLNDAIGILASTLAGRDCLRQKLNIEAETKKYFFGKVEISTESLQIKVNDRSVGEWLSMTTDREVKLEKIRTARQCVVQARFFASRGAGSAAASYRPYSEEVNPLLQQLVYGEESKVKEGLEAVKNNVEQLLVLLENTGTVQDYSGRTISQMTLLQAAAAAGDVEMFQMLKDYMMPEAFTRQLTELFPEGIEAHDAKLQQHVFNFDSIIATMNHATLAVLETALSKEGAQFTETDSVRGKSDDQLTLVEALNRFREQFSACSNNEKIFNPYHLLRAYEAYYQFSNQCKHDSGNYFYKKCTLFWCQIVGHVQRFVPACYAQAFVQGLWDLVKAGDYHGPAWRPTAFKRNLKFKSGDSLYFPADPSPAVCSGLGFDFAINAVDAARWGSGLEVVRVRTDLAFLKALVEQKQLVYRILCGTRSLSRISIRTTSV